MRLTELKILTAFTNSKAMYTFENWNHISTSSNRVILLQHRTFQIIANSNDMRSASYTIIFRFRRLAFNSPIAKHIFSM
jgi:hypothetical protein